MYLILLVLPWYDTHYQDWVHTHRPNLSEERRSQEAGSNESPRRNFRAGNPTDSNVRRQNEWPSRKNGHGELFEAEWAVCGKVLRVAR